MTDPASRPPGDAGGADGTDFVRRGHFVYESGDHGDTWLALELLFTEPERLERAAVQIADQLAGDPVAERADLVCGPVVGGALLGQSVARSLGVGFVYAEREAAGRAAEVSYRIPGALRPLVAGRRVAIVDDAINAGAATRACRREVEALGGRVVAVACWVVRADADKDLSPVPGRPIVSLHEMRWSKWSAADCPLCKSGAQLDSGL